MVEDIDGVDSGRAVLLVSKDQIDPLVKMLRHVIALEGQSVHPDELARILLGPGRKHNVPELNAALLGTCKKRTNNASQCGQTNVDAGI